MSIKLTDKYLLSTDGKYNLILQEGYEKKSGTGKNAKPTGEIGYRDAGYFGEMEHIANFLLKKEVMTVIEYEESDLKLLIDTIKEAEKNITAALKEKVVLEYKK